MAEPFSPEEIQEIIGRVRRRLGGTADETPARPRVPAEIPEAELGEGLYATIDEAVRAAERALNEFQSMGPDGRQRIVDCWSPTALPARRISNRSSRRASTG